MENEKLNDISPMAADNVSTMPNLSEAEQQVVTGGIITKHDRPNRKWALGGRVVPVDPNAPGIVTPATFNPTPSPSPSPTPAPTLAPELMGNLPELDI